MRKVSRYIKPEYTANGEKICPIPPCTKICEKWKNGNYKNYCSNHSGRDMYQYTSWPYLRSKAIKRDNHTCQKCGKTRGLMEGDHIIPIALGGEEFDLDNVQTLCYHCHKRKTKSDVFNIALKKRKLKREKERKS